MKTPTGTTRVRLVGPAFLSNRELAGLLRCDAVQVMRLRRRGVGPAYVVAPDGHVRYPLAEVERWLNGQPSAETYTADLCVPTPPYPVALRDGEPLAVVEPPATPGRRAGAASGAR